MQVSGQLFRPGKGPPVTNGSELRGGPRSHLDIVKSTPLPETQLQQPSKLDVHTFPPLISHYAQFNYITETRGPRCGFCDTVSNLEV